MPQQCHPHSVATGMRFHWMLFVGPYIGDLPVFGRVRPTKIHGHMGPKCLLAPCKTRRTGFNNTHIYARQSCTPGSSTAWSHLRSLQPTPPPACQRPSTRPDARKMCCPDPTQCDSKKQKMHRNLVRPAGPTSRGSKLRSSAIRLGFRQGSRVISP